MNVGNRCRDTRNGEPEEQSPGYAMYVGDCYTPTQGMVSERNKEQDMHWLSVADTHKHKEWWARGTKTRISNDCRWLLYRHKEWWARGTKTRMCKDCQKLLHINTMYGEREEQIPGYAMTVSDCCTKTQGMVSQRNKDQHMQWLSVTAAQRHREWWAKGTKTWICNDCQRLLHINPIYGEPKEQRPAYTMTVSDCCTKTQGMVSQRNKDQDMQWLSVTATQRHKEWSARRTKTRICNDRQWLLYRHKEWWARGTKTRICNDCQWPLHTVTRKGEEEQRQQWAEQFIPPTSDADCTMKWKFCHNNSCVGTGMKRDSSTGKSNGLNFPLSTFKWAIDRLTNNYVYKSIMCTG
jgi:precorrin-2 methylase